jgi:hypothetical protein
MQCHEFDGLLSDALDGVLAGSRLDRFRAHARVCSGCGPMFAEVEAGRSWLKELTEVEPPARLLTNVLVSTSGVESRFLQRPATEAAQAGFGWSERAQAWVQGAVQPIIEGVWATVRQPRFAMSFGMAFFSLSVALSMLGVKASDLRQVSLRPAAIRHTYYNTQARVVRYYDNIKLVYEVQAAVRELKRNVAPAEPRSEQSAPEKKDHKNDTTQQPEQKQERNYSQTEDRVVLACAPLGTTESELPVVPVTAYRRLA